jgi:dipeptidase
MWAARKVQSWAISNCYSLGSEFDLHSTGLQDDARKLGLWNGRDEFHFAKTFDTRLYAFVGGAHRRRALNSAAIDCGLEPGWAALAARLRDHGKHGDDFASHDNRQICLHAGSMLRPSQTTASLIARLAPGGDVRVAATGTSAPCMGLFEPLRMGPGVPGSAVIESASAVGQSPWSRFEPVHQRALIDAQFRRGLRAQRDALEMQLFQEAEASSPEWNAIARQAQAWRQHWAAQAAATPLHAGGRLGAWWRKRALRELAQAQDRFP